MQKALDAGLDLVEVSPNVDPPVCRVMNYGKFRFEQRKKQLSQKKKQKQIQVKEIKLRPATDVGDYQIKLRKIKTFLERGDKVRISIRFRGREVQHKDLGVDLINKIKADLPAGYSLEQEPRMEGKQISMVVFLPKK